MGDRAKPAVRALSLSVRRGEIVGIAGVSGNGQRELMQALVGQRAKARGPRQRGRARFLARRAENRARKVRSPPEEPLGNACVGPLSVAQNMALRSFDELPWHAVAWCAGRPAWSGPAPGSPSTASRPGRGAPIRTLSGGNVQRAVLARELAGEAELLLVSNPSSGSTSRPWPIHGPPDGRLHRGAAVLLVARTWTSCSSPTASW